MKCYVIDCVCLWPEFAICCFGVTVFGWNVIVYECGFVLVGETMYCLLECVYVVSVIPI